MSRFRYNRGIKLKLESPKCTSELEWRQRRELWKQGRIHWKIFGAKKPGHGS